MIGTRAFLDDDTLGLNIPLDPDEEESSSEEETSEEESSEEESSESDNDKARNYGRAASTYMFLFGHSLFFSLFFFS